MGKLLVISAHGADWCTRAGGVILKYAKLGWEVTVFALTYGEHGESGNYWKDHPGCTLDEVKRCRKTEAKTAAEYMGVKEIRFFDYGDYPIANVSNRYTFMIGVIILLLFLGMFMDVGASILILGPLLAPAAAFGIDPVQFGLIFIFSMAIGQATPPFGTDLFVVCGFSGRQVMAVGKHSLIFCTALVAVILLCMFFPQIATALPNIMT